MKNIQSLFITAIFILTMSTSVQANTITEVLSGSDNGFGFSGLHHATGCQSMCGGNFSSVSLSNNHISFFHENDFSNGDNFKLYLTLDNYSDSLLTLSGVLDFTVGAGELIGEVAADFDNESLTNQTDTVFKFVQGSANVGGINVPKPNGISGDLLSLWGANSTADHLPNSIGFDPNTASLGIDLVLRWDDSTPPNEVSEPASLVLFALGLFGLGAARLRK